MRRTVSSPCCRLVARISSSRCLLLYVWDTACYFSRKCIAKVYYFTKDLTRHSPQNTPEAIAHLCRTTRTTHLICHDSLVEQADAALKDTKNPSIVHIAPRAAWKTTSRQLRSGVRPETEKDFTALIMHTSGSTGMPKVRI